MASTHVLTSCFVDSSFMCNARKIPEERKQSTMLQWRVLMKTKRNQSRPCFTCVYTVWKDKKLMVTTWKDVCTKTKGTGKHGRLRDVLVPRPGSQVRTSGDLVVYWPQRAADWWRVLPENNKRDKSSRLREDYVLAYVREVCLSVCLAVCVTVCVS